MPWLCRIGGSDALGTRLPTVIEGQGHGPGRLIDSLCVRGHELGLLELLSPLIPPHPGAQVPRAQLGRPAVLDGTRPSLIELAAGPAGESEARRLLARSGQPLLLVLGGAIGPELERLPRVSVLHA